MKQMAERAVDTDFQNLFRVLDRFQGSPTGVFNDPERLFLFKAQIICWARLSRQKELAEGLSDFFELNIREMAAEELRSIANAFDEAARAGHNEFDGFGDRLRHYGFAFFSAIVYEIQSYFQRSNRTFLGVADLLIDMAPKGLVDELITREVAKLMAELLNPQTDESVYIPFLGVWTLVDEILKRTFHASWEVEYQTQFSTILSALSFRRPEVSYSDPLRRPGFVDEWRLREFDCGATATLGRGNVDLTDDPFNRFPEKTNSSDVLIVRHLLSQVTSRAVILLHQGFLFKTSAAEKDLKAWLVERGWLDTVISLPAGLLSRTGIASCILILNKKATRDQVLFVDASDEGFWEPRERRSSGDSRIELRNQKELLSIIQKREENEHACLVSKEKCRENDYNLMVDRYLSIKSNKQLQLLLEKETFRELEEVADFIRAQAVKSKSPEDGEEVDFLEVSVSDIDDDGMVRQPRKAICVKEKFSKALDQAVKPGDIVLAIKGSVGKVGYIQEQTFQKLWIAGQSLIIIRAKPEKIESEVLFRLLGTTICQSYIESRAGGSAVKMFQMRDLKAIPIPDLDQDDIDRIKSSHKELLQLHEEISLIKERIKDVEDQIWNPNKELVEKTKEEV